MPGAILSSLYDDNTRKHLGKLCVFVDIAASGLASFPEASRRTETGDKIAGPTG
jgi:hypothetical protein